MKLAAASLVAFLVSSMMLLSGARAEDAKGEKKAEKGKRPDPTAQFFALPKGITLTEEQNAKLAKVKEEYAKKAEEAAKARADILTPEQKKSQSAARKAAQAEGKKGKELRAAVSEAMKLTDEQKPKLAEADKKIAALKTEIQAKIAEFLTEEQKAKLPQPKKGKKKDKQA